MAVEAIKNEKILYYFGAGASAKALPLARSVWEEKRREEKVYQVGADIIHVPKVKGLAYDIKHFLPEGFLTGGSIINLAQEKSIKKDFQELSKHADKFGDVDTYAKYLQIMHPDGEKLNKLKKQLSYYFSITQTIQKAKDPRYVPWLVGIMEENRFPENIKILSWNYDSQIQIAARTFGYSEDLSSDSNNGNYTSPLVCCYPDLNIIGNESREFSLIHLNGRAGITDMKSAIKGSVFQKENCSSYKAIIEFLSKNDVESSLHFAWENSTYHNDLMQHVSTMIEDVSIMVVIGYSFPFFNREVDKAVFKQLKANKKFYKIYYQDPILDGQQLKSQFELDKDFPIVHISQTENFHIPFEY